MQTEEKKIKENPTSLQRHKETDVQMRLLFLFKIKHAVQTLRLRQNLIQLMANISRQIRQRQSCKRLI